MSFIDRVRAFMAPQGHQGKSSAVAGMFARTQPGQPRWTPRNFEKLSDEGFSRNAVVYRCINLIGTAIATIPWCLRKGEGKAAKEIEDPKHPLLMLLKRPNPQQGGHAFIEAWVAYFLLHGNSYMEGVAAGSSDDDMEGGAPPKELYVHRPDRIKIIPDSVIGNMPGIFRYEIGGYRKDWRVNPIDGKGPILHWRTFNPLDDWYGQSVISAAAYAVDQHNEAGQWNQALLQNGAVPSGAFRYAPTGPGTVNTLTEEQRRQAEKSIEEKIAGAKNARRPLIMDGNWEWIQAGLSPQDMDWLEGRKASALDICSVFGVPAQVYGLPDSQTFANYEQARLAFYEETVIPLYDAMCDQLNHWLTPTFGEELDLDGDWDQVDALAPKRQAIWDRVSKADWLTTNEKREATGYEVLDDPMADEVLIHTTDTPLSMVQDPAEADDGDGTDDETAADEAADNAADENDDTKPPGKSHAMGKGKKALTKREEIGTRLLAKELIAAGISENQAKALASLAYKV